MPYEITWYSEGEVLQVALHNDLSLEELNNINQQTTRILDGVKKSIYIVIDASNMNAGYYTVNHLRNTQHYLDHPNLSTVIVTSENKLNRLVTLLAFNLCRAQFIQFDSPEKAESYMSKKGISGSLLQ
ncbi:MAG: hypothetical protein K8I82_02015 [Anaerolineae bacterium]|jgi:hypothetical protein|nr:hypothetical protein [Anaerolineae bacterium]